MGPCPFGVVTWVLGQAGASLGLSLVRALLRWSSRSTVGIPQAKKTEAWTSNEPPHATLVINDPVR